MEDAGRPEEVAREKELEVRLRRTYDNSADGPLPADLVSAALTTYKEIVEWHERSIRLTAEQFAAAKRDPKLFLKCVKFLLVSDSAEGKRVPLISENEAWLLPELGMGKGWVRVNLWLPRKPPPRE